MKSDLIKQCKSIASLLPLVCLAAAPQLFAQDEDESEETYELSPFVVSTEKDTGYIAHQYTCRKSFKYAAQRCGGLAVYYDSRVSWRT